MEDSNLILEDLTMTRVHYRCPKCKEGRMESTGKALLSSPPQYPHECTKCGHEITFTGKVYPLIQYKIV